jgi:predicted dehydrogenase
VVADWHELIASSCDAVIIATPPATHPAILEACVEAGKPCLVEKPLCLDVPTAERLHRRVQASGVLVMVDHTHLFSLAYRELKQMVRAANEPIRTIVSEGMGFGPFRAGLSALWDWAPHDVSLCLDLLETMPLGVDAMSGPHDPGGEPEKADDPGHGAEKADDPGHGPDMVSLRLDFPAGTSAWIQAGRLSAQRRRSLSVVTDTRVYLLDDLASSKLMVANIDFPHRHRGEGSEPLAWFPIPVASEPPPMVHVMTDFLDGISGGNRSRFGTELALGVTRVLAACQEVLDRRGANRADGVGVQQEWR